MLEVAEIDGAAKSKNNHAMRQLHRHGVDRLPTEWKVSSIGEACSIRNEFRLPLSVEVRSQMKGQYPYYGPTGVLDWISDYRADGDFALIGEDGDHFLDVEAKPQTIRVRGRFNVNNHAHLIAATDECFSRLVLLLLSA